MLSPGNVLSDEYTCSSSSLEVRRKSTSCSNVGSDHDSLYDQDNTFVIVEAAYVEVSSTAQYFVP